MVEQVKELTELGLPAVHLMEHDADCMKAISEDNLPFIFCCAEHCLLEEFQILLKSEDTGPNIQMVVVDKSHTVETW